jgi:hypothetical protein
VDDIDIRPGQNVAEIAVAADAGAGGLEGGGQMVRVHVADGEKTGPFVFQVAQTHLPDADDGFGQFVARREISGAAEDAAGDDRKAGRGRERCFQEGTSRETSGAGHADLLPGVAKRPLS